MITKLVVTKCYIYIFVNENIYFMVSNLRCSQVKLVLSEGHKLSVTKLFHMI